MSQSNFPICCRHNTVGSCRFFYNTIIGLRAKRERTTLIPERHRAGIAALEVAASTGNLRFLMATMLRKKNSSTRTWIIEGFDGSTCFFQQTLAATFLPDTRIIALLQRLLSRHLTAKDIIAGSTTLRDPFHNPIFGTRREIVDGGISITVGENPYYVATCRHRPYKKQVKN